MQVAGEAMAYYVGCVPTLYATHMVPAIGAVTKSQAVTQNATQASYFAGSERLPVTEINVTDNKISQNPKYFDQPKPVHSYVAGILFQQGLIYDQIRGSIGSSSQRESPSACYGISTPGRAIYQGGIGATGEENITTEDLKSRQPSAANVIARRGGHTLVMDDGDLKGQDNLIRIRTSKGHQITMSDDGNCLYICHANGQAYIELGQEGTLDVYTSNSVNLRTQGTINLHADEDINMFAGRNFNVKSVKGTTLQSDSDISLSNKGAMTLFSQSNIGFKTSGALAITSQLGSWAAGSSLSFNGSQIQLNGGPRIEVQTPTGLTKYILPSVDFNANLGWVVNPTGTESIVTRAPTHEPYPYHNQGVSTSVKLASPVPTPPPETPPVPKGVTITATAPSVPGLPSGLPSIPGLPTSLPNIPGVPSLSSLPGAGSITNALSSIPGAGAINNALPGGLGITPGAATPGAASTGTVDRADQNALINDVSAKQREYERLVSEFGRLDPRVDAALAAFKEANARLAESAGYRG
jgi:hypothetical protein